MTNNSRIFKSLKLIVFYLLTIKIQTLNIQKVSQVYAKGEYTMGKTKNGLELFYQIEIVLEIVFKFMF